MKKILFVFGTRPELIKMAPLVLKSKEMNDSVVTFTCSTGQHKEMLESLYKLYEIKPDFDLQLMKPNQNLVTLHSDTMLGLSKILNDVKPDWVVVQGDTTTAHAAAMTAFYMKIPVAHVEAGLRTYDMHSPFPEEMNRRAIGLVASAHFCPTEESMANLKKEQLQNDSLVEVTGNTGIDSLRFVSKKIDSDLNFSSYMKEKFSFLKPNNFVLTTMHRRENFGKAQQDILRAFLQATEKWGFDILFPVHPNPNVRSSVDQIFSDQLNRRVFWTQNLKSAGFDFESRPTVGRIFLTDPLDYQDLVFAMRESRFIMTDSGGIQEEAPTFKKRILVLRTSTERPEGIKAGFSELVGTDPNKILESIDSYLKRETEWQQLKALNPYGDGDSSKRILHSLIHFVAPVLGR